MARAQPSSRARRFGALAFVCLCVFLAWAYAVFMRAPAVGIFHDDGVYVVTAKALAEGDGYRIISIPGEPRQTKYPILFPWLVSLVWRVYPSFPNNLLWLRMVPFVAAVVWLWLSWRLVQRLAASNEVALAAVLLTAASPWVLFLSTTLLSESLFAALATGGLLLIVQICARRGRRYDALAAGVLMGASVLARTAGLAPAAAGLFALAMRRRWAASGQYAVAVLLTSGPWFWWAARHASEPIADPFYSGSNYASWNLFSNFTWQDRVTVFSVNMFHATQLGQFWGLAAGSRPALIAGALSSVLVLRGLWLERSSPVAVLVGFYLAMLLVWVFPPVRFIVPILPLLVWLACVGAGRLRPVAVLLAMALLASAGMAVWRLATTVREKGGTWYDADDVNDWREMRRQYDWIDQETARDAVLVGIHDPTYFLFTGRKALRPFSPDPVLLYYNVRRRPDNPLGTAEDFRKRLVEIGADYVIATPRDGVAPLIDRLSTRAQGSVMPVAGNPSSGYVIYRIDRRRLSDRIE